MIDFARLLSLSEELTDAEYADRRVTGRLTVSRSFPLRFGRDSDIGKPTRTLWEVVAEDDGLTGVEATSEGEEFVLHESGAGRVQIKARVIGEVGRVSEIRFERIKRLKGQEPKLESILRLEGDGVSNLLAMFQVLVNVDPEGADTQKISEHVLAAIMDDAEALGALYQRDPGGVRALVESDVSSSDIVAISAKKATLSAFEDRLDDESLNETDWQEFFEANPWLLGVGLSSQLFISWDSARLEQTVAGASVAADGKRVDAFLTTSGAVRSIVFAEIKRPNDPLVASSDYRSGAWAPSRDLVGGVSQALATVERARETIDRFLEVKDEDGYVTGEKLTLADPRSYLIIGSHESLRRNGQQHDDMVRSFELFRRTVRYPEILTYDEVLARARWAVARAEQHEGQSAEGE